MEIAQMISTSLLVALVVMKVAQASTIAEVAMAVMQLATVDG